MSYLIDTTILARLANAADPAHAVATRAVLELHRQGEVLQLTPQVLVEFRGVATRLIGANGLGLPAVDAEIIAASFESRFPLLPETADIYPAWKALVEGVGVIGKQVHDARLVAVSQVHKVSHLLTFNVQHFSRLSSFGPRIIVVDPISI